MSSPNHKVPSEIFAQIFQDLRQVDQHACALVCRRWQNEAGWLLWRHPIVTSKESLDTTINVLKRSPELRDYVKSLRIRGDYQNRDHPDTRWVKDALIQLARILPNVHSLVFEYWGAHPICEDLLQALGTLQHVTEFTLRHCKVENLGALEKLVSKLPRLAVLRLEAVSLPQNYPCMPALLGEDPQVRFQPVPKLVFQPRSLDWEALALLEKYCPKHLELVNIVNWPGCQLYGRYLKFLGPRLEALTFRPTLPVVFSMEDSMDLMCEFDLSRNTKLRSLVLSITDANEDYPAWILPVLRSAICNPLAEITFEMTLPSAKALKTDTWDQTLSLLTQFWRKTLRKVRFVHRPVRDELVYSNKGEWFLEDATEIFRERFYALHCMRILEVVNAPLLELEYC
ncbi:hypothetical protein OH77DRAFT_1436413 [Trametes cingulata]|nr:hypothetical protein OH77DRAFT_1436413 [Trametes cingulata]